MAEFAKAAGGENTSTDAIPERFLRAENGNEDIARKRWEATKSWREMEGINNLLVEKQPYFHQIKNLYPHYNAGCSRDGHVIYWERPAELIPQLKTLAAGGVAGPELLRHWIFVTEFQFDVLCKGDPLAKGITVIDLKGVGVTDFFGSTLAFVKKCIAVAGEHYPERAFCVYIINANWIATSIWAIVKLWLNDVTANKVRILSPADTLSGLQEHIDISQIPEYYGGQLRCFNEAGELVVGNTDSARFYSKQALALYELVRQVNSGEITEVEEVFQKFRESPDSSEVPSSSQVDGMKDGI